MILLCVFRVFLRRSPALLSAVRTALLDTWTLRSAVFTDANESRLKKEEYTCPTVEMLQVEMMVFVGVILWMCVFSQEPSSKVMADRYAVYWNRTNPR